MKKVRLFAIAAAMGMFASTVSAADYVTKDAYVATWGSVDEIIKVDVGDKVVAPIANISVVKETRSTDPKYATTSGSLGLEDSNTCFEGFTNTVGKDSNEDGYVDAPILTSTDSKLKTQGWLHTDAKFFPTAKTATYYVGLGNGEATGGRFLAPGAAKKDVYALALSHKHLENEEAVIKYFEEQNLLRFTYDEDGYIEYVDINPITLTNEKGKTLGTVATRVTSKGNRYSDDEIREDIVKAFVIGQGALNGDNYTVDQVVTSENYTLDDVKAELTFNYFYLDSKNNEKPVEKGQILIVEEDRYGNLIPTEATASDLPGVGNTTIKTDKDKIVIAVDNEDGTYNKYMTLTPTKVSAYTAKSRMVWDDETGSFNKKVNEVETDIAEFKGFYFANEYVDNKNEAPQAVVGDDYNHLDLIPHTLGLYHLVTPANTTDKIVIDTTGLTLEITGINSKKGTMTIAYGTDKELTVAAVKLDKNWYPAVNNEAELTKFVEKVLGLTTLDDDKFDKWVENYEDEINNPLTGVTKVTRTNAKGEKEEYIPENSLQHYKGTFCTYSVNEGTKVDAVVTSNADKVDTTTSGVKTLTLTAKVGDEVVGTKDVKVVVAPKYQREYKNGKVVKLTAFYLDGKTPYAVYNYDWSKKTYTATFYQQDGVTVASTANGTL